MEKLLNLNSVNGIYNRGNRYNVPLGWLWGCLNGTINKMEGGNTVIEQRKGLYRETGNKITTDSDFSDIRKMTFYNEYLVCAAYDDKWYRKKPNVNGAWSAIGTISANEKCDTTIYGDYLILASGVKARKVDASWNDTEVSSDGNQPSQSDVCHTHQYRLWLNDTNDKMKLYGSKVLNPTTSDSYTAQQDAVTIDLTHILNEEDEIIGVRTLTESIMAIFLKKHIVLYDAPSDYNSIKMLQIINVGALSNNSIITFGNDIIFASYDGIRLLTASIKHQKIDLNNITYNISSLYKGLINKNINNLNTISLGYNHTKNHLYVTFPYSGGTTLVYSVEAKQFVGEFKFHVTPYSWFQKREQTGIYVGADDGYIYKLEDSDYNDLDDGIYPFNFSIKYPYISEDIILNKTISNMFVTTESSKDCEIEIHYWFGLKDDYKHSGKIILNVRGSDPYWRSGKFREARFRESSAFDLNNIISFHGRGNLFCLNINKITGDARLKILDNVAKIRLEGEQ